MKFIKSYKSTLILILSMILGGLIGILFGEDASILKYAGEIYLNMLLVIIVPLIFLSISMSIYKMKQPRRMGRILGTIFICFFVISVIASLIGIIGTYSFSLVDSSSGEIIKSELVSDDNLLDDVTDMNIFEKTVSMLTVDDFFKLLSRDNMIALIVVSILVGVSMQMVGGKADIVFKLMDSMYEIVNKFIKIIGYYAPIGIGCYFASLVGTMGMGIAVGYLNTFIIYTLVCIVFVLVIYTLCAYVSGGTGCVVLFWKNILPATFTALATCSSAASMPINIDCTKNMGVSSEIANTTISLGTNFHKDGSVIGSVFKIMFLVYLFNDISNVSVFKIIGISILSILLITAVPIGGGTISEVFIITMMGYSMGVLPILTMIATIIDAPATVLNVVGDSACSMVVSRFVDGREWFKRKDQDYS